MMNPPTDAKPQDRRNAVERAIDAPLGPALRWALYLRGGESLQRAERAAMRRGRDNDSRKALMQIAAARQRYGPMTAALAVARLRLLAARRASLALLTRT